MGSCSRCILRPFLLSDEQGRREQRCSIVIDGGCSIVIDGGCSIVIDGGFSVVGQPI